MKTTTQALELASLTCAPRLRHVLRAAQVVSVTLVVSAATAFAQSEESSSAKTSEGQGKKPNILVIMGDDIGWYNPSIYHRGDMGYWTPNIDRIGKEGAMFTCWYGQRAAPRDARPLSPDSLRFVPV
jgi:arylsulfatase